MHYYLFTYLYSSNMVTTLSTGGTRYRKLTGLKGQKVKVTWSSYCCLSVQRSWLTCMSVQFSPSAILDPRVGHTMDVLFPLISVVCHSNWSLHAKFGPRAHVVYPIRTWSSSHASIPDTVSCVISFFRQFRRFLVMWLCGLHIQEQKVAKSSNYMYSK